MTKMRKTIISLILLLSMLAAFTCTALAAPPKSGFHKCNGVGNTTGANETYTTTITETCTKITVWGDSDSRKESVTVCVYAGLTTNPSKLVATKTLKLNDSEQKMIPFHTTVFNPGTYTVTVASSDGYGYEVGTYFYK